MSFLVSHFPIPILLGDFVCHFRSCIFSRFGIRLTTHLYLLTYELNDLFVLCEIRLLKVYALNHWKSAVLPTARKSMNLLASIASLNFEHVCDYRHFVLKPACHKDCHFPFF